MQYRTSFLILLGLLAGCAGARPEPTPTASATPALMPIKAGGVYTVISGKSGGFSVLKVLVFEQGAVHAAFYSNEFKTRPTQVNPKHLKLAIGHVPLDETGFRSWQPVLLYQVPVKESELEGYRLWKNR